MIVRVGVVALFWTATDVSTTSEDIEEVLKSVKWI